MNKYDDLNTSSYVGLELSPSFLDTPIGNSLELKKENGLLKDIDRKEKQIYQLIYKGLGKSKYSTQKPISVIMFENRLKKYLFSSDSKFLKKYPSLEKMFKNKKNKKDKNLNHKINIGSVTFYSFNDNKNSNEIFIASNKAKYLSTSKNFLSSPTKDEIGFEYFRLKHNKNYNRRLSQKFKNIFNDDASMIKQKIHKNLLNTNFKDELNINSLDDKDNNNFSLKQAMSFDNNKNNNNKYNNSAKNIFNNINYLTERKIFDYKNKNKFLKSQNKKYFSFNNISINSKSLKNILNTPPQSNSSRMNSNSYSMFKKKLNIININTKNKGNNIKLFKYFDQNNKFNMANTKIKARNLFNTNKYKIKKTSKKFKNNFNNNIQILDKTNKKCNSQLLDLVVNNKSDFIKNNGRRNNIKNNNIELKKILSNEVEENFTSNYTKNKIKEEKLSKMKILMNDTILENEINRILKKQIDLDYENNYIKINKENDNLRIYNMISKALKFGNDKNSITKDKNIIGIKGMKEFLDEEDLKKKLEDRKINKIKERIKKNYHTIMRLKNIMIRNNEKLSEK